MLGDDAYAVLDDFRSLLLRRGKKDRTIRKLSQDKGHRAGVRAFIDAVRAGGPAPIPIAHIAAVSAATLGAVESLATGEPVAVGTQLG